MQRRQIQRCNAVKSRASYREYRVVQRCKPGTKVGWALAQFRVPDGATYVPIYILCMVAPKFWEFPFDTPPAYLAWENAEKSSHPDGNAILRLRFCNLSTSDRKSLDSANSSNPKLEGNGPKDLRRQGISTCFVRNKKKTADMKISKKFYWTTLY